MELPAIQDFDITSDGRAYLVLRYMRGGSLADRLKRGSLTFPQIQRIFTQIAAALDYAHSKGVIHRDIKPVSVETGRMLGETAGEIANRDFGGRARAVVLYYGQTPGTLEIRTAMQTALLETAPDVEIVAEYSVVWENDIFGVLEALQWVDFDLIVSMNHRVTVPLATAQKMLRLWAWLPTRRRGII